VTYKSNPAIDVVIGTIALERDCILVTDDDHFEVFQSIEPRLKLITFEMFTAEITENSDI